MEIKNILFLVQKEDANQICFESQKSGEFLQSILFHQNQINYVNFSKCQPKIQRAAKQKQLNNYSLMESTKADINICLN